MSTTRVEKATEVPEPPKADPLYEALHHTPCTEDMSRFVDAVKASWATISASQIKEGAISGYIIVAVCAGNSEVSQWLLSSRSREHLVSIAAEAATNWKTHTQANQSTVNLAKSVERYLRGY